VALSDFLWVSSLPLAIGSPSQWVRQSVESVVQQGKQLVNLPKNLELAKKQTAKKQAQVDEIQRIVEAIYHDKPVGRSLNQMQ
jgi:hypothetical protein